MGHKIFVEWYFIYFKKMLNVSYNKIWIHTFLYSACVIFGEIDFPKVSYLYNIHIWIWIIAVNHPKTSKFNIAFEFSMISWYYSYNIHNNMRLLVSHYPDFLITSCIHTENYVQSIVLYVPSPLLSLRRY